MPPWVRSFDGVIIFGNLGLAVVMLGAISFVSGGPNFSDGDLSLMAMIP